jgi:hypothetical protein
MFRLRMEEFTLKELRIAESPLPLGANSMASWVAQLQRKLEDTQLSVCSV